jgi:hypothetical protein
MFFSRDCCVLCRWWPMGLANRSFSRVLPAVCVSNQNVCSECGSGVTDEKEETSVSTSGFRVQI